MTWKQIYIVWGSASFAVWLSAFVYAFVHRSQLLTWSDFPKWLISILSLSMFSIGPIGFLAYFVLGIEFQYGWLGVVQFALLSFLFAISLVQTFAQIKLPKIPMSRKKRALAQDRWEQHLKTAVKPQDKSE